VTVRPPVSLRSTGDIWIGLSDTSGHQDFAWMDEHRTAVSWTDWGPAEPNNGTDKDHVILNTQAADPYWYTASADQLISSYALCQYTISKCTLEQTNKCMHTCMQVTYVMYACTLIQVHTYTCIHARTHRHTASYKCSHTHIITHSHARAHTHIYTYVHTHTHTHTTPLKCSHKQSHIHMRMRAHIYTYIHTHAHPNTTYICPAPNTNTRAHTHAHTPPPPHTHTLIPSTRVPLIFVMVNSCVPERICKISSVDTP
jgi:hypothetical protein